MQAGDWGITLTFVARSGIGLQSFSGATQANLIVLPPNNGPRKVFPLTIAGGGGSASYTTQEGDFPADVDGAHLWQLEVTFPSQFIQTPLQTMSVGQAI